MLQDLFEGLAIESSDGSAQPAVASSWEVDSSGTVYTFHIRPGARWSNGKPVLAENFVWAWERVVNPETASPVADDLALISGAKDIIAGRSAPETLGAKAVDGQTLVVHLERPAPYFPGVVTHTSTFPIYAKEGSRIRDLNNLVCNGAFVLKRWEPGTRILLQKNSKYWNAASVGLTSVEYEFSSDENSQYSRYRANELDMTDAVPVNALPSIKQLGGAELVVAPYLATAYLGLNLAAGPLAKNRSLREALSLAIDRARIAESLGFGQTPAYSLIPASVWNYRLQSPPWSEWSPEVRQAAAKRIFAESGLPPDKHLRLRVLINSNPVIKQTALQIASMWKDVLGIDTDITEEEYRVFLESRHDKKRWDVARLAWIADFNDASNFLDILRSNSANNDEAYADPSFDSLVASASVVGDADKRRDKFEEAERLMLQSTPIIPLYYYVSKRLVKPYVKGVSPSPLDRVPSRTITVVR